MTAITVGTVQAGLGARVSHARNGEAVAAGKAIYLDATDMNRAKLADPAAEASAQLAGFTVAGGADEGYCAYVSEGVVIFSGSPLTKGTWYALSPTPGGIGPLSDLDTGDYPTLCGYALDSDRLYVRRVIPTVSL
ncbi:hypothetical protein G4Y79_05230 [Phototrophicus methaneseepsis]|uniref:Uncharacterized protein n=1 Tax=Phototrophicus methaneseepsis TaxID=2710758 RepID=A0A7S8EBM4_9CHLR|nr:hypothetical protein [Phototrophicus methaneseepsis]QPC83783.1 hypothetical protein G4Y79_05230 [Phototrophicus methaneseepsis]